MYINCYLFSDSALNSEHNLIKQTSNWTKNEMLKSSFTSKNKF